MVLEQCESDQAIKVSGRIGLRVPCYSCAPGKSILASLPPDELETYLNDVTLKKFTSTTLATRSQLSDDLQKIRKRGYGLDLAEGMEGIHCVSAVILDDYHYPVAAITVIAPSFRLKRDRFEEIGKACIQSAQKIREELFK